MDPIKPYKPFKSWRAKYKPAHENDKLGTLKQEISNLKIRNRSENDPDLDIRIKDLEKQHADLSKKYQDLANQ